MFSTADELNLFRSYPAGYLVVTKPKTVEN